MKKKIMMFKVGDNIFDPEIPSFGEKLRWDNTLLSRGFGSGTIVSFLGTFILVKYDSTPLLILHSQDGIRYDRMGITGTKPIFIQEETTPKIIKTSKKKCEQPTLFDL